MYKCESAYCYCVKYLWYKFKIVVALQLASKTVYIDKPNISLKLLVKKN